MIFGRRRAREEELQEELRSHLRMAIQDRIERGETPEEAERAARREFGNTALIEEITRAQWGGVWLDALRQDLRYAARTLRSSPGFTTVAALTLAIGIGATTAIFSAINPILFEPLPYPRADRLVMLWDFGPEGSRLDVTFGTYRELAERSHAFEHLAVMKPWKPTMTSAAEPERFEGQRVSADYFRVLGISPALGRDFEPSDDRVNGPRVVILGDALWRRRFGGDHAIVGRQITLDGSSYTVAGVMPSAFENVSAPAAELWAPLQYDASLPLQGREWGHHLRMTARLRDGVDMEHARRELDALARAPVAEFPRPPWASLGNGILAAQLQEDVTGPVRPALLAVTGAVTLVLLIACVNVTNLLLARGARRRGEFAMRSALGASASRLVRQLVTESLLLAACGGALGVTVAHAGVQALVALSPPGLPRIHAIEIDGSVLVFALAVTTLVGLAIGLTPALYVSSGDLYGTLQRGTRRIAGGHQLARRVLVVAQVALALVLLVSAGLLLRSLQSLFAIAPGFEPAHVLTLQVQTSGQRFADAGALHRYFGQALEAVRQVPGVDAAGFTSQLPLSGEHEEYGVHFEADPTPEEDRSAFRYAVSPSYFQAMGIPLLRGRLLEEQDGANAPIAVLVNDSLARRKFPGGDAIGRRLRLGPDDSPWATIVGVVGDVKQTSLAATHADAVYIPTTQWRFPDRALWLVVRARGDAATLAPDIRRAIWSVDKDQPIVRVATMDRLLAASAAERRFALVLFEAFGVVALALAAVGIYGVLSASVAERTREIGVRLALGASRRKILAMVLGQGMRVTGLGVAIGLAGAAAASHALVTLLFGVSQLDPVTYLSVVALLALVSGAACVVPAWRAARVDPSITLRSE